MPYFRAYFMNAEGGIFAGEDIEATELSEAISAARKLGAAHTNGTPDHIEVWSGRERLFTLSDDDFRARERNLGDSD